MKEKYVEERFPRYFIFGESPDKSLVDVSDAGKDICTLISKANAESIIADRDKTVDFIFAMANAFDKADKEAFVKFWYG